MAKQANESGVYRVTEIIGTNPVSWEDAAKSAVETAATSLRDLRVAEISKLDMKIEGGKVGRDDERLVVIITLVAEPTQ